MHCVERLVLFTLVCGVVLCLSHKVGLASVGEPVAHERDPGLNCWRILVKEVRWGVHKVACCHEPVGLDTT